MDRQEAKLLGEIKGMFENMTKAFVDMKNVGLLFINSMYIMVKIRHGILVSTMYLKPKSFQDMFTKQIKQILYQWLFCFLHVCLFVFFPARCAQKSENGPLWRIERFHVYISMHRYHYLNFDWLQASV